MSEPKQPHDALFKKTFSDVEHAAAELRAVLPAQLVSLIDFSTLALCAGSYVDEALAGSQSDLLFSVTVSTRPALLFILFEHQSQPDKLMPLRLLRYILRILERHVEDATTPADTLPLPVVIPVVLHHGEGGWTAALRLEDLFDRELVQQAGLAELVPRLSFVLDDLSQLSDEALEKRALGLLPLLTLWALRDARSRVRLERGIEHWVPAIAQLLDLPNGQEALWTLLRYIAVVADDTAAKTLNQALEAAKPQVKGTLMTLAEKWLAEGQAKGKAEGQAEGKAEGKAETLRKLLTLKFGELPDTSSRRLAAASEAELDRWIDLVLTATTLEDAMPV